MKLLVDTNVFLDYFLKRENFEEANDFFNWCWKYRNQIYVTSISLRDIGYVARHKLHNEKLSRRIQNSVYRICFKVIGVSADAAIDSIFNNRHDYEDSLQICSANEHLLDGIVTNNVKDFKDSEIPIFTPKQLAEIPL